MSSQAQFSQVLLEGRLLFCGLLVLVAALMVIFFHKVGEETKGHQ